MAAASLISIAGARAAPGNLTVALPGDFPSLIPSDDSSPLGFNYRLNVFDQLTFIERDGRVGARLATGWAVTDDLLVWTFKLRTDARFHNGTPVTAKDVEFTTRYILDNPQSPTRTLLRLIKDVRAVDDDTVEFTLNQPYAFFERQISFINIMSKAYHEQVGNLGYSQNPVGSGPYKFIRWVKDDRLELEAFNDYWGGPPALKRATFRPIPADTSRATALLSGEVDLVTTLPPPLIERLRGARGLEVGTAPGSRVIFVGFNVNASPLDNPNIREAIDLAIDRKAITEKLLRGLGQPASMMIPPNNVGYDPATIPVAQDMARAKQLVSDSGYKGDTIFIDYPSNNIILANETVQAIAGFLTEAGLKVDIRPAEFTAFFPQWAQTKMKSMYMFAYGSTQYHADTILTAMYETGGRVYKLNEEVDALAKEQRRTVDRSKQNEVISRLFRIAAQDRYNLPLYYEYNAFGMKAGTDYVPWPDGFVRLYEFK
jgi:peptide/nickel transport system substrate-binding protein